MRNALSKANLGGKGIIIVDWMASPVRRANRLNRSPATGVAVCRM